MVGVLRERRVAVWLFSSSSCLPKPASHLRIIVKLLTSDSDGAYHRHARSVRKEGEARNFHLVEES